MTMEKDCLNIGSLFDTLRNKFGNIIVEELLEFIGIIVQ